MAKENWRREDGISRLGMELGVGGRVVRKEGRYLELSVIRAGVGGRSTGSLGGHAQLIARSQNGRCDLEVATADSRQ